MKSNLRRYLALPASGLCMMVLFLCASFSPSVTLAQTAPKIDIDELAQMPAPQRLARLTEGARREGTLNLYTSMIAPAAAAVKADFERRYPGVKLNLWRASAETVLQRAVTEASAKRHAFDVLEMNGLTMEAAYREKLLRPVTSPYFRDLIPQAVMPHREWVATRLNLFVQCYNTTLVARDDIPKTFEDLLHPRWKGRLAIEVGDASWFMSIMDNLGEEKGVKLFRDIVAANGVTVHKGHALMTKLVVAGEFALGLSCYSDTVDQDRSAGVPVDWVSIGPLIGLPAGMGVSRNAPHPHAALLFYDYMISDAQPLLAKLHLPSVQGGNNPALKGYQLKLVDPKRALDEGAKWEKLFSEIFVTKNK